MKFKKLVFIALCLFVSIGSIAQTHKSIVKHRVILHLTSKDTLVWKGIVNNIKNLKASWKDSVKIEVVAHGSGVEFLMKDKTTQAAKIGEYKAMGVDFVACENTIRERKLSKDQFIQAAGFVKSGIGEIILKEEEGWSYLKIGF